MKEKEAGSRETSPSGMLQQQGCFRPLRQGARRSTGRRSQGDIVFQVLKQQLSSDAVVVLHVVERGLFNQIAREVTRLRREGADLRDERRATGTAEIRAALRSLLSARAAFRARTSSFLACGRRVFRALPALVRRSGLRLGSPWDRPCCRMLAENRRFTDTTRLSSRL